MMNARRCPIRTSICIGLLVFSGAQPILVAQQTEPDAPLVIDGKMPLYPAMARAARIQGVVKFRVKTDGQKAASVDVESGPPMLARFARENIMTWEFAKHKPTTFVTTFEYVIEEPSQCAYGNNALILNLPSQIRITAKGLMTCDPAVEIERHP